MSQSTKRVHLFNCDNTCKLEPVEKLLEKFSIHVEEKHSFRLAQMSEMVAKIPNLDMDMAFFVVHAHESRLSTNEDNAGIGYAKIYRALREATGGDVIVVIGGDDNYKGNDEENREVISLWAKRKVASQFGEESFDGRRSAIFSWNKQHRAIHEHALLHHFDLNKKGQKFEYNPPQRKERPKPATPPPKERTLPSSQRSCSSSVERQSASKMPTKQDSSLYQYEAFTGPRKDREEHTSAHPLDSTTMSSSILRDRENTAISSDPGARSKEMIPPQIGQTKELAIFGCDMSQESVKDVEKFFKSLPSSLLHCSEHPYVANLPITKVEDCLRDCHFRFSVLLVDVFTVRDGYDNQRSRELQRLVRLAVNKGVEKVIILICNGQSTKGEVTYSVFTEETSKMDKVCVVELNNGKLKMDPYELVKVMMLQERPSSLKQAHESVYPCHTELRRDYPPHDPSERKSIYERGVQNTPQPVLATQSKENPFPVVLLRGIARYGMISMRLGDLQIWDPEFTISDDFREWLLENYRSKPEIGVIVIKSINDTPKYYIYPNLKEFLLDKEICLRPGEDLVLKTRVCNGEVSFKEEDVQFKYGNLPIPQYIIYDLQRENAHGDLYITISKDSGKFRKFVVYRRLKEAINAVKQTINRTIETAEKKYHKWSPKTFGVRLTKPVGVKDEVPPEIRARGPLAFKAYKKAISEGKTTNNRVAIMLIGQDRSGKTSLVKSLKREIFNQEEDSTIGIDVDPSYFKVATEIWKLGETDGDQNFNMAFSFEHHAARLTVQNFSDQGIIYGEEGPKSNKVEHFVQGKSVETGLSDGNLSLPRNPDEVISGSCLLSEGEKHALPTASVVPYTTSHYSFTKSDTPNIPEDSTSISMSQDQETNGADLVGSFEEVPEEVITLIEVLLKEDNDVKNKEEEEEDIYSILWDFGGQSVYYITHPLFLTSRAIYLLVNDLSRDPQGKAESVMKQGTFCKQQDSSLLKTNWDYLDFWMSSVASIAIHDESYPKECNSEVLPEKLPPVFLVCTHADKPYDEGDPTELARMTFGHLQTKPYQGHLLNFFTVDNTKSGHGSECQDVVRLREKIRAVAKELPQMKEAIPIKWLRFEKEMQAAKNGGRTWISFEYAEQIAYDVCHVADDEEFRTLLNFLHDQRILIHFDDTPELNKMVVLDAQWLIDVFKEVITIRPFDNKDIKFKKLWLRLEKEGILEESLLEHVWGSLYQNEDTCKSLIAIMEKFSLLCSWPSSDGSCGKQYLVPSMLMSHPPEDIVELVASAEIPPLFIKFESGQVPPGLFPRVVLHFLQWCKQECTSPEHPQLYHNFVRIYDSKEENCSVVLLCHMSSIEVVPYRGDDGHEEAHCSKSEMTSPVDNRHDTFACAVLRQLELMLESMRREFCWLQIMKYEISFLCPVCCQGGAVSYCRTHRTKNCKQEECLHFWPESKLFSDKKMICCTRSETAKISRISVKNFEPWFSPMRNQFTVDKFGGGNLAPVEDGEETFSAEEVLQISLTQQGDDQNILPQLKESLQLEQAFPDTLDSDSKRGDMVLNLSKTTTTTEVSLPDNVEKSLLSASCDANEIVHQLKENLRLDKNVLEQPDHDTKIIIRNLAQKAKDLRRPDVFKRLREIVPAGTTGPLLPENLPVQNMPISKARELTIDLVGGDEWMELAEGLGLTPQEIRFLDKRTLNPMDAALSFIAKQRHLSVGELYELLIAHDFPMLADLL